MEHAYQHDDFQGKPDAKIWIVQADASVREKTGKSWCVWIDPDFYESNRKYGGKILSWIDKFDRKRTKLGFCEGRPMTSMAMKIPTCLGLDLPAILVSFCRLGSLLLRAVCSCYLPTYLPRYFGGMRGKGRLRRSPGLAPFSFLKAFLFEAFNPLLLFYKKESPSVTFSLIPSA